VGVGKPGRGFKELPLGPPPHCGTDPAPLAVCFFPPWLTLGLLPIYPPGTIPLLSKGEPPSRFFPPRLFASESTLLGDPLARFSPHTVWFPPQNISEFWRGFWWFCLDICQVCSFLSIPSGFQTTPPTRPYNKTQKVAEPPTQSGTLGRPRLVQLSSCFPQAVLPRTQTLPTLLLSRVSVFFCSGPPPTLVVGCFWGLYAGSQNLVDSGHTFRAPKISNPTPPGCVGVGPEPPTPHHFSGLFRTFPLLRPRLCPRIPGRPGHQGSFYRVFFF